MRCRKRDVSMLDAAINSRDGESLKMGLGAVKYQIHRSVPWGCLPRTDETTLQKGPNPSKPSLVGRCLGVPSRATGGPAKQIPKLALLLLSSPLPPPKPSNHKVCCVFIPLWPSEADALTAFVVSHFEKVRRPNPPILFAGSLERHLFKARTISRFFSNHQNPRQPTTHTHPNNWPRNFGRLSGCFVLCHPATTPAQAQASAPVPASAHTYTSFGPTHKPPAPPPLFHFFIPTSSSFPPSQVFHLNPPPAIPPFNIFPSLAFLNLRRTIRGASASFHPRIHRRPFIAISLST